MNVELKAGERAAQPTVCHFSDPFEHSVSAEVTRLESWAAVRQIETAGKPFLRLNGNERMIVHLPIVGCADPRPETGVIPGRLQAGHTLSVENVRFSQAASLASTLGAELDESCGLSGPVEFHAGANGFAIGTLVFPVLAVPNDARPHRALAGQAR